MVLKYLPKQLGYVFCIHILTVLFLSFIRFAWYLSEAPLAADVEAFDLLKSLIVGVLFDNAVISYVSLLPLIVVFFTSYFTADNRSIENFINIYYVVLYVLISGFCIANIPFYQYFQTIINPVIFNWNDNVSDVVGMLCAESSFYIYYFLYFLLLALYIICIYGICRLFKRFKYKFKHISGSIIFIFAVFAVVIGARGGFRQVPLNIGRAVVCNNSFFNKLPINPIFNILYYYENVGQSSVINLMDSKIAEQNVTKYLNRTSLNISPLYADSVKFKEHHKYNVVVIFMESMSAAYMSRFGNKQNVTPNLDSLYNQGLSFSNCYSAGIHTNQGIYSTITGMPSLLTDNFLKRGDETRNTLTQKLKSDGYYGLFIITGEPTFDNMISFASMNGFDRMISETDYPQDYPRVNCYGVPDDCMFRYGSDCFDKVSDSGNPFFAIMLTVSNHPPYVLPDYYEPASLYTDETLRMVAYSDWSLGNFMRVAKTKSWYSNTLFVILGDHGKTVGDDEYSRIVSQNHIPLIFYGDMVNAAESNMMCGQIDIPSTVLGILGLNHLRTDVGVDLIHETRKYAFYTGDNIISVTDSSHLLLYDVASKQEIRIPNTNEDSLYADMKNYLFSMMQMVK